MCQLVQPITYCPTGRHVYRPTTKSSKKYWDKCNWAKGQDGSRTARKLCLATQQLPEIRKADRTDCTDCKSRRDVYHCLELHGGEEILKFDPEHKQCSRIFRWQQGFNPHIMSTAASKAHAGAELDDGDRLYGRPPGHVDTLPDLKSLKVGGDFEFHSGISSHELVRKLGSCPHDCKEVGIHSCKSCLRDMEEKYGHDAVNKYGYKPLKKYGLTALGEYGHEALDEYGLAKVQWHALRKYGHETLQRFSFKALERYGLKALEEGERQPLGVSSNAQTGSASTRAGLPNGSRRRC